MRVALDISRNVRGSTAKRILPERSRSNSLAPNSEGGYRVRDERSEMTVRTAGRSRMKAVGLQPHGAVMLPTAPATCRNALLRLHEGQSKSGELQDKYQTGKQPAHEEEIVLHHEAVTGARLSTWPRALSTAGRWHGRLRLRIAFVSS